MRAAAAQYRVLSSGGFVSFSELSSSSSLPSSFRCSRSCRISRTWIARHLLFSISPRRCDAATSTYLYEAGYSSLSRRFDVVCVCFFLYACKRNIIFTSTHTRTWCPLLGCATYNSAVGCVRASTRGNFEEYYGGLEQTWD